MADPRKGAGPHAGSRKSRRVEKLFHKMAARLEEAGDLCRVKGGGSACTAFDVTAGVLKHAPAFMAEAEAETEVQQASREPSSVGQMIAESPTEATPEKTVAVGTSDAAIEKTDAKAGETVATAEVSGGRR